MLTEDSNLDHGRSNGESCTQADSSGGLVSDSSNTSSGTGTSRSTDSGTSNDESTLTMSELGWQQQREYPHYWREGPPTPLTHEKIFPDWLES